MIPEWKGPYALRFAPEQMERIARFVANEVVDGEVDDDAADDLLDSGRFIRIYPIESREGFRWMEDFAEGQADHVRERLLDALDRPRPFRRFRDALQQFPQVRDAWYHHEDEKLKEAAREWLESRDIDAELVIAPPPEPSDQTER